jgi:hypothetical protein
MIPVGEPRHDRALEVLEHAIERFAVLRRVRRKLSCDVARLRSREHGVAIVVMKVICDPIDEAMGMSPEFLRRHVAECGGCRHAVDPTAMTGVRR